MSASEDQAYPQVDPLLRPLIHLRDEAEATAFIAQLIQQVTLSVVTPIITAKLGSSSPGARDAQETGEVQGDVIVHLLARLNEFRADPRGKAITSWRSYAATTTYHACSEYFRQKYPERHRLKNKLRYHFTKEPGLATWHTDDWDLRCGLESWRDRNDVASDRIRLLLEDSTAFYIELPAGRQTRSDFARLIDKVVTWVGGPMNLDDLVNVVAHLWHVKDHGVVSIDDPHVAAAVATSGQGAEIDSISRISDREDLRLLWTEIRELPVRQRAALLLNLREDAIMLLPITGVASIQQIAVALDRSPADFARLWTQLPLDDAAIAVELNVTRQQVINLRKSARARLARRMKAQGGNIGLG